MPHVTVEDLVAVLQQLPPEVSAVNAVSQGLWHLDSRAVAALLKVSLKYCYKAIRGLEAIINIATTLERRPKVFGRTYVHACTAVVIACF